MSRHETFNFCMTCVAARHLKLKTIESKVGQGYIPDPYVKVKIEKVKTDVEDRREIKYKTEAVKRTVDPRWDKQPFVFTQMDNTEVILIEILDSSSKQNHLGLLKLSGSKIQSLIEESKGEERWFHLKPKYLNIGGKHKEDLGEICLKFFYDEPSQLKVIPRMCRNLKLNLTPKEKLALFLTLKISGNKSVWSTTTQETRNPAWDGESFYFDNCHDYHSLTITVWNGDRKTKKEIANSSIDIFSIKKFLQENQAESVHWIEVRGTSGDVVGKVGLSYKIQGIDLKEESDTLLISAEMAINVPPADENGLSDPFLKFTYNRRRTYTTEFIRESIHPVWNPPHKIAIMNVQDDDEIHIGCWDWNPHSIKGGKGKPSLLCETKITVRACHYM